MSWLKQHNPEVDWNIRVLRFAQYNHIIYIQSTYRQRSIVDKRISRKLTASSKLVFSQKNDLTKSDSTDTGRDQSDYKVRINKENYKSSESLELSDTAKKLLKHVLQIYNSWKYLFQEEETAETLSKYQL